MSRDEHTLCMFLNAETPAAIQVAYRPDPRDERGTGVEWLPRSLIGYLRKDPAAQPGHRQPVTFTLPEWKIEQANLWEFVKD